MAHRLFIYVPFSKENPSDIKQGAEEFAGAVLTRNISTTSGHKITTIHLNFLGEEPGAADIDVNDVVLVHAHGGSDDTELADNAGGTIAMTNLTLKLNNYSNAGAFYFAACYAAKAGHIATVWAKDHDKVYGYDDELQGALVSTLRGNKYKNSMLEDDRMKKVSD